MSCLYDVTTTDESKVKHEKYLTFEDMKLKKELLQGILNFGYHKPSNIQQWCIIPIIQQRNVIIESVSGSGKAAALIIGCLQTINPQIKSIQTIILTPTRECSNYLHERIQHIAEFINIKTCVCVGGIRVRDQLETLENDAQLIIGTPGRVSFFMQMGIFDCDLINQVIIYDAVDCFNKGFNNEINVVLKYASNATIALSSPFFSSETEQFIKKYLDTPVKIKETRQYSVLPDKKQYYIDCVGEKYKIDVLLDVCQEVLLGQTVIYCNKISVARAVQTTLEKHFVVSMLGGDLNDEQITTAISKYKSTASKFLITTHNIVQDCYNTTMVINYDMPTNFVVYYERVTMRMHYGTAHLNVINFITPSDIDLLKNIEFHGNIQFHPLPNNATHLFS